MDKYLKVIESLDWKVNIEEQDGRRYAEFENWSPAGEDIIFSVWFDEDDDLPDAVWDYYTDFDPEEHAGELYEAGKHGFSGVPSLRILLDDADEISDMLEHLARALQNAA